MALNDLAINNFRNIALGNLSALTSFNLIYGNNGSGKTSILESIYFLSLGDSFRAANISQVINKDEDALKVRAIIENDLSRHITVDLEYSRTTGRKANYNNEPLQYRAELTRNLPVRILNNHSMRLLEASPAGRRAFIDWGAFYIDSDFINVWKNYHRTLKQRNAALKGNLPEQQLQIWNEKLINYAKAIDACRSKYIEQYLPVAVPILTDFIDMAPLDISYYRGWNSKHDYKDVLHQSQKGDAQLGYTQFGPHRADLSVVTQDSIAAKNILSSGQQKTLVSAMIVAQVDLLNKLAINNNNCIILIDDLPSELDRHNQKKLVSLLLQQKSQLFVTAIDIKVLKTLFKDYSCATFHVKHGRITAL